MGGWIPGVEDIAGRGDGGQPVAPRSAFPRPRLMELGICGMVHGRACGVAHG